MGLHLNEGGDDLQESHEINVTPFIDVGQVEKYKREKIKRLHEEGRAGDGKAPYDEGS